MPLKHRSLTCSPGCAVEATLDLIDGKWKGLILYHLLQRTRRFNELRRLLPNVTQRMLTTQLREMEMNGIIVRTVYPQVPPRVDYSVSELGQSLSPVISALKAWGRSAHRFYNWHPQDTCWGESRLVLPHADRDLIEINGFADCLLPRHRHAED